MMRYSLTIILCLVFAAWFTGCIEVIDFGTDRSGGQLVVDGSLVTGEGPFELYLGRTASTLRKTIPVEGARITLFAENGGTALYRDQGEGKYLIPSQGFRVEEGRTYYIQIELDNGAIYESEPETIPPIRGTLDSLYFDFEEMEELNEYGNSILTPVVNAYVDITNTQGAEQRSFYRFDVEEVYLLSPTDFPDPFGSIPPRCYIYTYPDLGTYVLLAADGDQVRQFTALKVASARLDFRFDEKHYFNIYRRSLTENAYTFWDQINQTLNTVGTIFDTPPAPVRGNLFNVNNADEQVLGYFSAMASDTIRAFILPSDTPYLPYYQCRYNESKTDYPARCLECISLPGATYEKPDYF